jgi:hypothetical protein
MTNLTPHPITIRLASGRDVTFPPSGIVGDLDRLIGKISVSYVDATIQGVFAPRRKEAAGGESEGYWLRGEWVR